MSEQREFVFEPINFTDASQKAKVQFTTKIYEMVNGRKENPVEETEFIHHQWSGFASAKYNAPEKRDWMQIEIDPSQKSCLELKDIINKYDQNMIANQDTMFGKFSKSNLTKLSFRGEFLLVLVFICFIFFIYTTNKFTELL